MPHLQRAHSAHERLGHRRRRDAPRDAAADRQVDRAKHARHHRAHEAKRAEHAPAAAASCRAVRAARAARVLLEPGVLCMRGVWECGEGRVKRHGGENCMGRREMCPSPAADGPAAFTRGGSGCVRRCVKM
eukprot:364920-Chlamydomonas_euryale.AAC.6